MDSARHYVHEGERAFDYYDRLHKVRDYVDAHLAEQIPLETAAGLAHLEPRYFSRFFGERVGEPFSVWLARRRVAHAARLLREKEHAIAEIVTEAGFGSEWSCRRWFHRLLGMSPVQYRRRVEPRNGTSGGRSVPEE